MSGVNSLLWRNTSANRLHTWSLDGNWNWVSSQGWIDPNSNDGFKLESQFNQDLNGNSIVGPPANYITLSSVRSVAFQQATGSKLYAVSINGSAPKPITNNGTQLYEGIIPCWQTLGAAIIGGINTILWRNISANRLHTWTVDGNWNWMSSQGWIDPSSLQGQQLEAQFGRDLDGNSLSPFYQEGSSGVEQLIGTAANEVFAPLGVAAALPSGGFDRIITGGGVNQFLLNGPGGGNLYAAAGEKDYVLITGFSTVNDRIIVSAGKAYAAAPISLNGSSGTGLFEDRNSDGLYTSVTDDLLALVSGVASLPSTAWVLG
ncbi:MAG: hypothetical protein VKI83_06000 [Synechococcaceae cyanobacterium]|nr:hypothetical protein [Synechococcaceae cyanobacterium]